MDLTFCSTEEEESQRIEASVASKISTLFDKYSGGAQPPASASSFQRALSNHDAIIKSRVSSLRTEIRLKKENLSAVEIKNYCDELKKLDASTVDNGLTKSIENLLNYLEIKLKKIQDPKENRSSFNKALSLIKQASQGTPSDDLNSSSIIIVDDEEEISIPVRELSENKRKRSKASETLPKKRKRRSSQKVSVSASKAFGSCLGCKNQRPHSHFVSGETFGPSTSREGPNKVSDTPVTPQSASSNKELNQPQKQNLEPDPNTSVNLLAAEDLTPYQMDYEEERKKLIEIAEENIALKKWAREQGYIEDEETTIFDTSTEDLFNSAGNSNTVSQAWPESMNTIKPTTAIPPAVPQKNLKDRTIRAQGTEASTIINPGQKLPEPSINARLINIRPPPDKVLPIIVKEEISDAPAVTVKQERASPDVVEVVPDRTSPEKNPSPPPVEDFPALFTPVHIQALAIYLGVNTNYLTEAIFKAFNEADEIIAQYEKWLSFQATLNRRFN